MSRPPAPSRRPLRAVRRAGVGTTVLLAVVLSGCSDDGTADAEVAQLRSELAAVQASTEELSDRVAELEAELAETPTRSTVSELAADQDALRDRVASLADEVAVAEAGLEARGRATDARLEDLETSASDLRAALADARADGDDLAGELEQLTTQYETLRDRLDRLQRES